MKDQQHPANRNPYRSGANLFSRWLTKPLLSVVVIALLYVIILTLSYNLGYFLGLSFTVSDITASLTSKKMTSSSRDISPRSSETHCAEPLPSELIHQTIIDQAYNGKSPHENFILPRVKSVPFSEGISGWSSYGVVYKNMIEKVRPKTIIKLSTCSGVSETYMANLTSQVGLKTQILCLAMPDDDTKLLNQFIQYEVSQNATECILPVPLSIDSASEKLCEWGIYGDLIEVDAGHDFHSAWSHINSACRLLRPGGILYGHKDISSDSSYYDKGIEIAVRLFARVNKLQVKVEKNHWMISFA